MEGVVVIIRGVADTVLIALSSIARGEFFFSRERLNVGVVRTKIDRHNCRMVAE